MKKRHLEIQLSRLKDIVAPDPRWEQYRTPSRIASDILWMAFENGDIEGRKIVEMGCGGAPFALGALMLGAPEALGFDIDPRSLSVAQENLDSLVERGYIDGSSSCEFIEGDVSSILLEYGDKNVVFMNPPFGAQTKHADRPFIEVACRTGHSIYSIHNGGTEGFIQKQYEKYGHSVEDITSTTMELPHRFNFHSKEKTLINVLVIHTVKS